MTKVKIEKASEEQFHSVYGYYPCDNIVAWVALKDGVIIGIAGVFVTNEYDTLFLNIVEKDLKKHDLFIIIRYLKKMIKLFQSETSLNMVLIRETTNADSVRFLDRLGFEFCCKVDGEEIWQISSSMNTAH